VARILAAVRARIRRLLMRRQIESSEGHVRPDPLSETSPVLAGIVSASVQGRIALGPRAGARVRRLGDAPDAGHATSRGPRQAQLDGFDLHANVWVPPNDRVRLEQLSRYLLRPPLARDRVRLRADGRVLVELKTARRDGTSHLIFDPIEFMEKLAAITPRPAVNLVIYHGVLAPRARWRAAVVRDGRPEPDAPVPTADTRPRGAWTWAALMHRVFALDVLACPRCGGRLRVIAIVEDPAVVQALLAHAGRVRPLEAPGPGPPARVALR